MTGLGALLKPNLFKRKSTKDIANEEDPLKDVSQLPQARDELSPVNWLS
jgi:hypothetical protein